MTDVNPYLRLREKVFGLLEQNNPGISKGQYKAPITTALDAALEKAKYYELDAGAAATGDLMARIRNAGKAEGIKRDFDENQALVETKIYQFKQLYQQGLLWTQA